MRVFLGLAALAAVNAQVVTVANPAAVGANAQAPPVGTTALTTIEVRQQTPTGPLATVTPALGSGFLNSLNWVVNIPNSVTALAFVFNTNQYTGQMQYRWAPNYPSPALLPNAAAYALTAVSYTCDPCAGSTPISCNTAVGPGGTLNGVATSRNGFACSNLPRTYLFSNLQSSTFSGPVVNSFSMQLFDIIQNPAPNVSSYSFQVIRAAPAIIVGDPQIVGMQGQDFQVHGMPDEIFNMVTAPQLQVNARFTYLESAACHDNYTACFAHPGTYITEEGIRVGKDRVRVTAGSFKKGLTVHVNGKRVTKTTNLADGAVELVNHRRAVVHTDLMTITITNSDKFMNQELALNKQELVELGATRKVLKDNERFHPEVPLHGLQGQTWRNVEYSSGLDYEGSIMDYHVVDGNLFGTDFVFNQFKA